MGTRCAVAVPHGDSWRGRYVHWDGYPSAKVPFLQEVVRRDGLETARRTLVEDYYGWSSLSSREIAHSWSSEPRFASVPGYGEAYTTIDNQSHPDRWVEPDKPDGGVEYCYVLRDDAIEVLDRRVKGGGHAMGMFGWSFNPESVEWVVLYQVGYGEDDWQEPEEPDDDDEEDERPS
jgi:hypothetical protein